MRFLVLQNNHNLCGTEIMQNGSKLSNPYRRTDPSAFKNKMGTPSNGHAAALILVAVYKHQLTLGCY